MFEAFLFQHRLLVGIAANQTFLWSAFETLPFNKIFSPNSFHWLLQLCCGSQ